MTSGEGTCYAAGTAVSPLLENSHSQEFPQRCEAAPSTSRYSLISTRYFFGSCKRMRRAFPYALFFILVCIFLWRPIFTGKALLPVITSRE